MARIRLAPLLLVCSLSLIACRSGDSGARIGDDESSLVQLPQTSVNLPPPPSFQKEHAPETYPDSAYSVYGIRKNAKSTLNQNVRVKGFIIDVYECPPCPKGKECDCLKPHFYLSDRATGPKDKALLVTDYPLEDPQTRKKTKFSIGSQYYVSGTFAKTSPSNFSDGEGLLVCSEARLVSAE